MPDPFTMAYWYAVGRCDQHGHDYIDPYAFAKHYVGMHDDYRNGRTSSLACIPDLFNDYITEVPK